jgi:multimeric flavodoxin WrbA
MYAILTSSPNTNGLTAACGKAALRGIENSGGTGLIIDLCREKIESCLTCEDGWGECIRENRCVIDDCLPMLQETLKEAEGIFLITPVYFGQPSEHMKYFCDRFRRCEAFRKEKSSVAGKKINLVAAAGGSGNGTVSCLSELETWCRHVSAVPFERIGITRHNRDQMLRFIEWAGADTVASGTLKNSGDLAIPLRPK